MANFVFALTLTIVAGLSTAIGGLFVLFCKEANKKFLSFTMGFSAGVMVFIGLGDLLPIAAETVGNIPAFFTLFAGIAVAYIIDMAVPHHNPNPHDFVACADDEDENRDKKLWRVGIFSMVAVVIHNFPEGAATFFAASFDITLGISMMIAIALHNIPEGLTIAVPIYYSTGSRKKAFWYAFLSGLSEPIGALFAGLLLYNVASEAMVAYILAFVGGFMLYLAFDELIPAAHQYDHHHTAVAGVIIGMFIMGLSILFI